MNNSDKKDLLGAVALTIMLAVFTGIYILLS